MKSFCTMVYLLGLCMILMTGIVRAQQSTGQIIGVVMLEDGSSVPGVQNEPLVAGNSFDGDGTRGTPLRVRVGFKFSF